MGPTWHSSFSWMRRRHSMHQLSKKVARQNVRTQAETSSLGTMASTVEHGLVPTMHEKRQTHARTGSENHVGWPAVILQFTRLGGFKRCRERKGIDYYTSIWMAQWHYYLSSRTFKMPSVLSTTWSLNYKYNKWTSASSLLYLYWFTRWSDGGNTTWGAGRCFARQYKSMF